MGRNNQIDTMAGFQTKTFSNHDDYMTPKSAWQNIAEYIPKDKQIWEAFYGDGTSAENLKELGFDVVSEPIDFYKEDRGEIIVTNPPFSDCKNVFERLAILDKPFIMILPVSKMNTNYFRDWLDETEAGKFKTKFKLSCQGKVSNLWKLRTDKRFN